MPGTHGNKKKKKKDGYVCCSFLWLALAVVSLILTHPAKAYLPHKDKSTEFRLVATSEDFSAYQLHGQVVGGSVLHPNLKVAGLLAMGGDSAEMKALVEYQLNPFIKLGVSAGMNNEGSGLGDFIITGDIPIDAIDILPFIKVTHQAVGEAGVVVYASINKVLFNVGLSFRPYISDHQKKLFTLMVGTGFK